jgi:hypothetical protein
MKKINYLLLLLTAVMLFAASCGKNGAPGPQGPIGATGPIGAIGPIGATGPAGTNGTNGTNGATGTTGATGATGTANVLYSAWITPASYTKDTVFSIYHFYANIPASAITQSILDNGTVVVYGKLDGYTTAIWPTAQVSPLPITISYEEGTTTYTDTWSALVTPGNVQIDFVDNLNLYGGISNAHEFRYIIIPGAVLTAVTNQHINLKDYNQVQRALHLPD